MSVGKAKGDIKKVVSITTSLLKSLEGIEAVIDEVLSAQSKLFLINRQISSLQSTKEKAQSDLDAITARFEQTQLNIKLAQEKAEMEAEISIDALTSKREKIKAGMTKEIKEIEDSGLLKKSGLESKIKILEDRRTEGTILLKDIQSQLRKIKNQVGLT